MSNLDQQYFDKESSSEVELTYLFNFFKRKSILIIVLTSFLSIIGGLISLRISPTYQGNFKIYGLLNSEIGNVLWDDLFKYGIKSKIIYEDSQKSMLNRRSTLKPVFENYNKKINGETKRLLTFSEWRKNLDVDFVDNSEMILTFKDKNKELLLETLKDLKLQYENYFKKNNDIQFENAANIIKARFQFKSLNNIQNTENLRNLKSNFKSIKELELKNELNNLLQTISLIKNQSNYWITISEIEIDKPIYKPTKFRFLLTTTFISFLLIFFIFLVIDFLSKKIYDFDILKMNIDAKYLGDLYFKDQNNSKILLNKIINQKNTKIFSLGLLIPDSISEKKIDLSKFLKDLDINLQQTTISNLKEIVNFEKIIIVTCKGACSYRDIELLNNYVHVYGEKIKGWVFIK